MATGILQRRTVDQLLSVLKLFKDDYSRGHSLREACHTAMRKTAERFGVTYQTIEDGCRRRLGLEVIEEFHSLLTQWMTGDGKPLVRLLNRCSSPTDHHLIASFFGNAQKVTECGPPVSEVAPIRDIRQTRSHREEGLQPEVFSFRLPSAMARPLRALAEIEGIPVGEWLAIVVEEVVQNKWRDRIVKEFGNLSPEERTNALYRMKGTSESA